MGGPVILNRASKPAPSGPVLTPGQKAARRITAVVVMFAGALIGAIILELTIWKFRRQHRAAKLRPAKMLNLVAMQGGARRHNKGGPNGARPWNRSQRNLR